MQLGLVAEFLVAELSRRTCSETALAELEMSRESIDTLPDIAVEVSLRSVVVAFF